MKKQNLETALCKQRGRMKKNVVFSMLKTLLLTGLLLLAIPATSQICLDTFVHITLSRHYSQYANHLKQDEKSEIFFIDNGCFKKCNNKITYKDLTVSVCPLTEYLNWRRKQHVGAAIIQINNIQIDSFFIDFDIAGSILMSNKSRKSLYRFSNTHVSLIFREKSFEIYVHPVVLD